MEILPNLEGKAQPRPVSIVKGKKGHSRFSVIMNSWIFPTLSSDR